MYACTHVNQMKGWNSNNFKTLFRLLKKGPAQICQLCNKICDIQHRKYLQRYLQRFFRHRKYLQTFLEIYWRHCKYFQRYLHRYLRHRKCFQTSEIFVKTFAKIFATSEIFAKIFAMCDFCTAIRGMLKCFEAIQLSEHHVL